MLNNKGFAISSILYTLLIAFLLFLGVALAELSSSSSLVGKANDDLINGISLSIDEVKVNGKPTIRVKSRYGIRYWTKDFECDEDNKTCKSGNLVATCENSTFTVTDNLLNNSESENNEKSINLNDKCSSY